MHKYWLKNIVRKREWYIKQMKFKVFAQERFNGKIKAGVSNVF
jgi:hypothetical protein